MISTAHLVEGVDLFPTVVEAAGIPEVGLCPEDSHDVTVCHEGMSLMPLTTGEDGVQWRTAAFSLYPRGKGASMG